MVQCIYFSSGCKEKIERRKIDNHTKDCQHRPLSCSICDSKLTMDSHKKMKENLSEVVGERNNQLKDYSQQLDTLLSASFQLTRIALEVKEKSKKTHHKGQLTTLQMRLDAVVPVNQMLKDKRKELYQTIDKIDKIFAGRAEITIQRVGIVFRGS